MIPVRRPRRKRGGVAVGGGLFILSLCFLGGSHSHAHEQPVGDYGTVVSADSPGIRVELLPKRRTTLSSETAARILSIAPREGRRFRKGETLVAFDCAMEEAQMKRARAILEGAEAKSRVNNRLSHLKATSKLEERVSQADAAKAQAELAIIQVKIDRCKIQAPFSGRVTTRLVHTHQYVKAGDPLMEILDEQGLEIIFLLPSRRLRTLARGGRFQVYIDETQRTYPARITAFGAMIDSISQSVKVFGSMDGTFPELLPGMSGIAHLAPGETLPAQTEKPAQEPLRP